MSPKERLKSAERRRWYRARQLDCRGDGVRDGSPMFENQAFRETLHIVRRLHIIHIRIYLTSTSSALPQTHPHSHRGQKAHDTFLSEDHDMYSTTDRAHEVSHAIFSGFAYLV